MGGGTHLLRGVGDVGLVVVRGREQIPPDAGGIHVEDIVGEVVLKREGRSDVVLVRRGGDEVVLGDGDGGRDEVVGGVGEDVCVARTGVDEVTEVRECAGHDVVGVAGGGGDADAVVAVGGSVGLDGGSWKLELRVEGALGRMGGGCGDGRVGREGFEGGRGMVGG